MKYYYAACISTDCHSIMHSGAINKLQKEPAWMQPFWSPRSKAAGHINDNLERQRQNFLLRRLHAHCEEVLLPSSEAVDAPLLSAGCESLDAIRLREGAVEGLRTWDDYLPLYLLQPQLPQCFLHSSMHIRRWELVLKSLASSLRTHKHILRLRATPAHQIRLIFGVFFFHSTMRQSYGILLRNKLVGKMQIVSLAAALRHGLS